MNYRLLISMGFLVLAGCTVNPAAPEPEAEPEAVAESAPPPEVEVPVGVPPGFDPDACELLLMSLEQTRPLLSNLDENLASQADRMEQAVERLNRPVPQPVAQDCPADSASELGNKEIIGAIEWLYMDPPGLHYRARIDSGAETSTLSASDLVEFERDGDDWVRFNFQHDPDDEPIEFELPVKRTVIVRQMSADDSERRFVVELDIRLGEQLQTTEFTLTNRSRMTYPVSLGRAFLMDLYVVDVSRSYTHERYDAG